MDDALNQIALNLLEAKITLYPADDTGAPLTDSPLWTGARAEGLRIPEHWITVETRPTGAPYPINHPLIPQYTISIDRVWTLALSDLTGFRPTWKNYVLDIVWTDEDGLQWHRRTFYGVTISERTLSARTIESGFTDEQVFQAQYYVPSSGRLATPDPGTSDPVVPPVTPDLPYYVVYAGAGGTLTLYTFDPGTHIFTPVNSALLTGRAAIGYDSGLFFAEFSGEITPVLSTTRNDEAYENPDDYRNDNDYQAAQFHVRGAMFTTAPKPSTLPRLMFYFGTNLICTVTKDGLYAARYVETLTPLEAAGLFGIYAGDRLITTLGAEAVSSKNFIIV